MTKPDQRRLEAARQCFKTPPGLTTTICKKTVAATHPLQAEFSHANGYGEIL
jgi:hypothetical protein